MLYVVGVHAQSPHFFNWNCKEKTPAVLGVGEAGSDGLHRSVNFLDEKLVSFHAPVLVGAAAPSFFPNPSTQLRPVD